MQGSFRDRLLTPGGAAAVTHPAAFLASGAGAAVVLAVGAPIVAAAAVGAAAWGAVAFSRVPKADRGPDLHAMLQGLVAPWHGFLEEAIDARSRFEVAVTSSPTFASTLGAMRQRMDASVVEVAEVATSGQRLSVALKQLPAVQGVRAEQAEASRRGQDDVAASLAGQIETIERLSTLEADTIHRLRLLDARLDEAVARAVALPLEADQSAGVARLADDLDDVLTGLRSLSDAVAELGAA